MLKQSRAVVRVDLTQGELSKSLQREGNMIGHIRIGMKAPEIEASKTLNSKSIHQKVGIDEDDNIGWIQDRIDLRGLIILLLTCDRVAFSVVAVLAFYYSIKLPPILV